MPQVKMLRDWKTRKEGDVWSPSESTAKQLIASGIAAAHSVVDRSADPLEPPAPSNPNPLLDSLPEPMGASPGSPVPQAPSVSQPASNESQIVSPITNDPPEPEPPNQEPTDDSQPPTVNSPPVPSRYAQHRSWIKKD